MKLVTSAAAAVCLALVGQSAYASAIPISSAFTMRADSNAGAGTVTDTDSQSQGATLNPLAASVEALALNGNASVRTLGSGSANWSGAAAGTVSFENVGWMTQSAPSGTSAFLNNGLDWSYTFQAAVDGTFHLNWNISTDGLTTSGFGLNGFGFSLDSGTFLNINTAGTLTRSLVAGNLYTAVLRNQANVGGTLGTRTALMDAEFTWRIDATVPEPATLFLLGSGLAVAVRRRRRA